MSSQPSTSSESNTGEYIYTDGSIQQAEYNPQKRLVLGKFLCTEYKRSESLYYQF